MTAPINRFEFMERTNQALEAAYAKHGRDQWGRHEFYGILREEFDELWDAIKHDRPIDEVHEEVFDIAAVLARYMQTGDRHGWEVNPDDVPF